MLRAIYPSRFDPLTYGHLDMIRRAARVADELILGVSDNREDKTFFTVKERVEILENMTEKMTNVTVKPFSGLAVDFAKENHATLMFRELHAISDFEHELQMAQLNRQVSPDIDTVFLPGHLDAVFVCSSTLKDIAANGRELSELMPADVAKKLKERIS